MRAVRLPLRLKFRLTSQRDVARNNVKIGVWLMVRCQTALKLCGYVQAMHLAWLSTMAARHPLALLVCQLSTLKPDIVITLMFVVYRDCSRSYSINDDPQCSAR